MEWSGGGDVRATKVIAMMTGVDKADLRVLDDGDGTQDAAVAL